MFTPFYFTIICPWLIPFDSKWIKFKISQGVIKSLGQEHNYEVNHMYVVYVSYGKLILNYFPPPTIYVHVRLLWAVLLVYGHLASIIGL